MREMIAILVGAMVMSGVVMHAQEEPSAEYVELMKQAGAKAQSIGQHMEAKNCDGIAADATELQEIFQGVGKFWTERDVQDALEACMQTYKGAQALQ